MDAIEALKTRRSIRMFDPTPVSREVIEDIVDCGRLAPSASNVQPVDFVVVTDPAKRREIARATYYGGFIERGPVCIGVLSRDVEYFLEDGSAATENVLVAARAHGLGTCWVAGDKKPYADQLRKMLGAPEGFRLVALVALGWPCQQFLLGSRKFFVAQHAAAVQVGELL